MDLSEKRISYSRHARGRMRLYEIEEADIAEVLSQPDRDPEQEGERWTVQRVIEAKFRGMLLKVVFVEEDETIVVI